MNAIDALRLADPAGSAAEATLRPEDEVLLREILASSPGSPPTGASPRRVEPRRRDRRPLLVTAAAAIVVVALAVVAIRLGSQAPHVASSAEPSVPTVTTELRQALTRVFPQAFDGRATMTWSDASPGGQGDAPVDLTDKVPVYAAACEGGGSITVSISGEPARTLDCASLTTLGPIVLDSAAARNDVSFSVAAATGHPRYLLKLTGVATSTPGAASSSDGTTTSVLTGVTPSP